ncbi:hypothetical protein [Pseudomonas veronii]|uniref:Uncharacterized protein n=1 Tax=Pseudomonas veronii TaxID=76761 RepID=A0A5M8E5C5_PSEVE|nr:hypothetical protein [Pseudomonas veronii]KAA6167843.1 hypothetical protein F3K53_31730 [Pseudomonas veronii]KAA6173277.1 hypothetical protein F3K54_19210 [Pseudomonas veronii]
MSVFFAQSSCRANILGTAVGAMANLRHTLGNGEVEVILSAEADGVAMTVSSALTLALLALDSNPI